MKSETQRLIGQYLSEVADTLTRLPVENIARVIEVLREVRARRKRVFVFGNGGSAATSSHFACDLSKGATNREQPRIRAVALVDNMPVFSAWANDSSYENVFAEQLENLLEPGDVAIGISGSGNSPNILKGVEKAREMGAFTIGFIGFEGGKLKELVDLPVIVPSNCMEQIEDIHLLLCHLITVCLRGGDWET